MSEKQEKKMEKLTSSDAVKWLKSAKGRKIVEESMKSANDRTLALRDSMRVNRENLLKPVTL